MTMKSKILVIDDDSHCIESYRRIFSSMEREVEYFQSPYEALESFAKKPFVYSIAFIDHQYRYNNEIKKLGAEIAEQLKGFNPMLTTCIVSGDESSEALQSWLSVYINNYIYKPLRKAEALAITEHYARQYERSFIPVKNLDRSNPHSSIMKKMGIIGESELIIDCVQSALRFSESNLNVLLLGETGTGKELFANGIHKNSTVSHLGIFPINCASYKESSQLLEVELFGSEKGAFTGAEKKAGIFEAANGGTVFLDEIHHLSMSAQSKLLRVLQEKKIRRIGGQKEYSIKFRLITAGKPNLEELCRNGDFSPDLYYRLKGLDLIIPPIRDRKRDIRPLIGFFLKKIEERTGKSKQISVRCLEFLEKYDWPGNIRELQQLIEKLNVIVDEDIISPKHLPKDISCGTTLKGDSLTLTEVDSEYRKKQIALIVKVLNEAGWNFTEATRRLGLGEKRANLRYRMKQLKIKDLSKNEKTGILHQLTTSILQG